MTPLNTPDMLEATRLAREGRLAEASALLQRLFRGEPAAEPAAAGPSRGAANAPAGTAPAAAGGMAAPQMPEALRGFLEQLNQGGQGGEKDCCSRHGFDPSVGLPNPGPDVMLHCSKNQSR